MKNTFEKILDICKSLKTEILAVCLIVFLLVLLNGPGPVEETVDRQTASAALQETELGLWESESGAEAETWKEGMPEAESETFTPAELAALGSEPEETKGPAGAGMKTGAKESANAGMKTGAKESANAGADHAKDTAAWQDGAEGTALWRITGAEDSSEAEVSVAELPMILVKMQQAPTDFRISPEISDTGIVEYQESPLIRRWQIVNERYRITGEGSNENTDENGEEEIVGYGDYRPFGLLKRMVENRIDKYDGDWSVYVKNLKTDESFVVNDQPMKSASVMKLFIMGTVYKAIEAGTLERTDEVVSLLNSMITESDNEASNRLLYLLGDSSYADGISRVDEFIQEYGFSDMTVEYNGFNNSETVIDSGHNNQVSAKDCGKLLEDIYRRSWVNRSMASEIEQMMLNQHTRYKIPAGLPEGVSCGNKTGEMDTTENDAAVVYGEDCDYILVVLSSNWGSKDQAISRIASMSGMVYRFLN